MAKKKNEKIPVGRWERGFALARLGFNAGIQSSLGRFQSKQTRLTKGLLLAGQLVDQLGTLKGGALKIGQMISVYGEHFFSEEVTAILRAMQSQTVFMPQEQVEKILKKELGALKLKELKIEPVPIAAASIGQVHRGKVLKTGQEIVLKIQYPNIGKAIEQDLKFLKTAMGVFQKIPKLPALDDLWEEVRAMLQQELDYEKEARELTRVRGNLEADSFFMVPEPIEKFSTKSILAMTYLESHPLADNRILSLAQNQRDQLGEKLLDLFFQELFLWNRVQTDAHFGNFGVCVSEEKKNMVRVALYDYGAVRELGKDFVHNYKKLLKGILFNDRLEFESAAKTLHALEEGDPPELKEDFFALCSCICSPFHDRRDFHWKDSGLPAKVSLLSWELIKNHPLRAPPVEVVFLNRKMGGLFTILAKLDVKISGRKILDRYL